MRKFLVKSAKQGKSDSGGKSGDGFKGDAQLAVIRVRAGPTVDADELAVPPTYDELPLSEAVPETPASPGTECGSPALRCAGACACACLGLTLQGSAVHTKRCCAAIKASPGAEGLPALPRQCCAATAVAQAAPHVHAVWPSRRR